MLLPARCERVVTILNRNVSDDTFSTLISLDKSVVTRRKKCCVQMEQRVYLKFLVKLGKNFTDAYAMLKEVYGNECLSDTQVFEWFKRFKERRETTEDDPRPGRPSTSKTDENIEKTGIDKGCVRQILHKSFNKVCAKMVPKLLTPRNQE
ncbi:hypothetical protein NQ318_002046 [Aromia moschata]|uniref:Mos1 transposase HTH domain-containing protein n=1 Tax=Aromia moschata TaxID=1265417 RepID=A0AAV8Z2C4_9CUCU|nr:hypothetical protein NQ318_002046 [Aromia moschata]